MAGGETKRVDLIIPKLSGRSEKHMFVVIQILFPKLKEVG